MTTTRAEWLRGRERHRDTVSWISALLVYLLIAGILAVAGVFRTVDVSDYAGPLLVRLGTADGADIPVARPERQAVVQPEPVPERPAPAENTSARQPAPPVPEAAAARPAAPTSEAGKVPDKPSPQQAAPAVPVPEPSATAQTAPPTPPPPVAIRGKEGGNSYALTMETPSGTAGRSMYVPIWLFMPLPFELSNELYEAIPDLAGLSGTAAGRRRTFARFYEKKATGTWQLKRMKQPEYDARPDLWTMLEDAGYDLANAEYKQDKKLRDVVILFRVSPAAQPDSPAAGSGTQSRPVLEDVAMETSSGYSDIDEAVMNGFRRAEFSNSGTMSIRGRFTYKF